MSDTISSRRPIDEDCIRTRGRGHYDRATVVIKKAVDPERKDGETKDWKLLQNGGKPASTSQPVVYWPAWLRDWKKSPIR